MQLLCTFYSFVVHCWLCAAIIFKLSFRNIKENAIIHFFILGFRFFNSQPNSQTQNSYISFASRITTSFVFTADETCDFTTPPNPSDLLFPWAVSQQIRVVAIFLFDISVNAFMDLHCEAHPSLNSTSNLMLYPLAA